METPFTDDWKKGFEAGKIHSSPSPETKRILHDIQRDFDAIVKKQDDIIELIKQIQKNQQEFGLRAVNWDNTNRIVYGLVALILVTSIGDLITFVFR